MIWAIVRELLLPLLLFFFLRLVLRNLFAGFRSTPASRTTPQAPPVQQGGVLHKDPVCGTYVSADAAVTRVVKGELVHFCSEECSRKYRQG
jgi:YHS domain-containing protein